MTVIYARREGHAFVPYSRASAFAMEELPVGVPLKLDATQPRNPRRHRLYWALMTLTARALNDGPTPVRWTAEDVSQNVKIATGHVEVMRLRPADAKRYGTDTVLKPKSISFAAMGDEEFAPFMEDAFNYIRDHLAPWISGSDYYGDILGIVGEAHQGGAS